MIFFSVSLNFLRNIHIITRYACYNSRHNIYYLIGCPYSTEDRAALKLASQSELKSSGQNFKFAYITFKLLSTKRPAGGCKAEKQSSKAFTKVTKVC